ncbi:hypothetical protein [Geothrix sp. PMB-07]|uniref:hypothetical protein n=1 Tax=Geothrix sp. PMB-07 TaxID=3068640 RepID=UPI0027405B10|nr:hypothetical protein [Geothrix sp. PMB-07]WLT30979.1 hypothetical protein Q9293_14775 [Geothrix sp. PMB-07]
MVAIPSRRLIHNLNEIQRLETRHFVRLGQGEAKTATVCGGELKALALHYKTYLGSRRLGLDARAYQDIEAYFGRVAQAMDQLLDCLQDQPRGLRLVLDTYEHGHSAWTLDGSRRTVDANNAIRQLWQDGHAAEWFLTPSSCEGEPVAGVSGRGPENRQEELRHLTNLMHRLSGIYRGLQEQPQARRDEARPPFDEKDALVFNLAELIKKKARPVLHTVGIATLIHEWATGDQHPQQARFQAAYQSWKNRPDPGRRARP